MSLPTFSASAIETLLLSMTNGAYPGTGLTKVLDLARKMFGGEIPPYLNEAMLQVLPAQFGGYPDHKDLAPSGVFLAAYILVTAGHCYVFAKNYSRGHIFYPTIVFILYGFLNWIGYALRICWSKDITRVSIGLTSTILLFSSTIFLCGANLTLAQRIYTWRHPKIASHTLFYVFMGIIYLMVLFTFIMGVVAGVVPFLYFLSESHFLMSRKASETAGFLCLMFASAAGALVILGFLHPKQKLHPNFVVYQPWWVKSFGLFYFVDKQDVINAKQSFVNRPDHHKAAVRVIVSSIQHYNTIDELQNLNSVEEPDKTETTSAGPNCSLDHNYSIFIILLTSVMLIISCGFRLASLFVNRTVANQTFIFLPQVMYCTHGLLEFLCFLIYLVCRVDLRFYVPDRLNKFDFTSTHSSGYATPVNAKKEESSSDKHDDENVDKEEEKAVESDPVSAAASSRDHNRTETSTTGVTTVTAAELDEAAEEEEQNDENASVEESK